MKVVNVAILYSANFRAVIQAELLGEEPMSDEECDAWVASPVHPLKNIAEATLQLFRDGDLPNIKSIREGDIKDTLSVINHVIDNVECKKNIVFVSGVPGSGKTLVGLKTVYDHGKPDGMLNPIYLSGNDPLVNILQNMLSSNHVNKDGCSYIQPMKNFKKFAYGSTVPMNDIIVFDEAQRAWDVDYHEPGETEASLLIRVGNSIADKYGKVTIVCLIGDGQAIHKNEETGMPIWVRALVANSDWNVYIPKNYDTLFQCVQHCHTVPALMLDTSIRHDFIDVGPWVEAIIALDLAKAKCEYRRILSQGFNCWWFRDKNKLPEAVEYIQKNDPGSHTGIVVSSHLNGNHYFGPEYRGSYVKSEEAYFWYTDEGPKLTRGASEFLIQGIELEYPIVSFVGDFYIQNGKWCVDAHAKNPGLEDLRTVIENVYRVLLTRSRKGMFLYFPKDPKLNETCRWFAEMLRIMP